MAPEFYLSLGTMHGTIMVFVFISYVLVRRFGNYLVPLEVGARDMAFPFLNMLSYWIGLLAALVALASFLAEGGVRMDRVPPAVCGRLRGARMADGPGALAPVDGALHRVVHHERLVPDSSGG